MGKKKSKPRPTINDARKKVIVISTYKGGFIIYNNSPFVVGPKTLVLGYSYPQKCLENCSKRTIKFNIFLTL